MTELLITSGGIGLAIVTYFFGKKKRIADTQKTELDNVSKAITIWRQLAQDMQKEMESWKEIANNLQTEVDELKSEVSKLFDENARLSTEVNRLSKMINNK